MGQYGDLDYVVLTKAGFLLGVGLFVLGIGGEALAHSIYESLPAWENTVLMYSEAIGILIGLLTPFVFGIILPLTE